MGIRSTVQIQNPDNPKDYIVIAELDFDPAVHTRHIAPPTPVLQDDPQPAYPEASLVAVGLDMTISKLGVWLADQTSVDMLRRLKALETRRSALSLIEARITVLSV